MSIIMEFPVYFVKVPFIEYDYSWDIYCWSMIITQGVPSNERFFSHLGACTFAASCYYTHHGDAEARRGGSRKSEIGSTHFYRLNKFQKSPISYLREQLVKRGKGAKFLYRLLRLPPLKMLREFVSACLKGANNSPNASEHEFTQSLLRASESPWWIPYFVLCCVLQN